MSTPHYDVIISGAGPVGLFLACELALANCSVLVLEKAENSHSPLKQAPFGIRGLSAPTIEALDRRGLLNELELYKKLKSPHKTADPNAPRQVGHFGGIPFLESNIDPSQWPNRLPSSTPTNLLTEMWEIESILTRRAEILGVEIRRGQPITNFHQTETGMTVHSEDQTFQSSWLVGCDGGRSTVRKLAGIDFAGTEPKFTGYSTQVELIDPEKLGTGRHVTPQGMYLQSQPGYVIIQDFDGGAFHDSRAPITLDHIQGVLRRVSGTDVTLTALHLATTWTDRARQATTYRHGRVLLAGDAAHIHAPLGGQGLNLGLGDVMNLGWKLAATIQDRAPEGLLDTYQSERYPIGEQVLNWSRAQVAIMEPTPAAQALNAIIRDLMSTRDGATHFSSRVWGINTHYGLEGNHPLTGHSAPNFQFEDGSTLGEHLRDGLALLLDFKAQPSLQTRTTKYPGQLKYLSLTTQNPLGLTAALIRPDGIIAWATDRITEHDELQSAARLWLKSAPESGNGQGKESPDQSSIVNLKS